MATVNQYVGRLNQLQRDLYIDKLINQITISGKIDIGNIYEIRKVLDGADNQPDMIKLIVQIVV